MAKSFRLSLIASFIFAFTLAATAVAQTVGTALVSNGPAVQGTVDGSVQQMTGTNSTINGSGAITGDLFVPGTPTLIKTGSPTFGGTIVGNGSASPSNYQVILNGSGTRLGHLRTRTNPVAISGLPAVPTPTGTRMVTITSAGQSAGSFATLKNLILNGNVGQYTIPAGTYGDFTANGGAGFTLGVAGATQPAVYNLQHLTLNGATSIVVIGPVIINVANGFTANGTAGTSTNPAWLKINIVAGNFTVNGGCTLYSYVALPAGTLTINGTARLTGGAISKNLTVNANGLLKLFDVASFENHPPVAANQTVTTSEDTAKSIVLSASDADGQTLTYSVVSQPAHGALSGTPPQLTYTPTHGYYGADSFTFKANDGQANSNVATVSITLLHVNHAPVANAKTLTLNQGTSAPLVLTGSDPDNDPITFRVTTSPAHGALSGTPPNLTYTPATNFYGTDNFEYVANDGAVDSAPATVAITVNHVNHPPVASGQSAQTNEDTAKAILLSATDVDSDPLTYIVLTNPAHGTLSGTAPNLSYTPTTHFFGSDSFTFRANDGNATSAAATVQITVVHVNHPPIANGQNISLDEDTTATIALTGTDPDSDAIAFSITTQPQHGTLSGTPPNIVYTPAPDYFGMDLFAFRTSDGTANSQDGIVNVTIRSINDSPTVQVSAPTSGTQFDVGDTVHITGTASDKDGTIATFRLLMDGVVISERSQTSTSTFDLLDVATGDHSISAVVIDNEGASAASTQVPITVRSQGNGPVQVNAGPDRLISLPSTAHLDGSVTVNGAPAGGNVQLAWQKVSGPGTATFDNSAALNPTVTFSAAGDYVLKLVATAPEGSGFDTAKVTILAAPQPGPDSPVSNHGREFWMAFLSGTSAGFEPDHAGAFLFISSEVAATGTVEISGVNPIDGAWQSYKEVKNFTVPAGGKALVEVDNFWQPVYDNQYDQALPTSIHIVADAPVAVHALSSSDYSTDGSLILPNGLLGLDYYVMSYRNSPQFPGDPPHVIGGTELAVVGTSNQTQVTITPTASTTAHPAGQPFTITLQRGEVFRMINKTDVAGDFTGTRVQSDKPVAVFGGHACAPVPAATPACDHLYEQIPPVDFWGRHFVTLPLKTRTGGDRFRMLASHDNTHVSINGEIVTTLARGQFYETVVTQTAAIIADQSILLAQFAQSSDVDHTTGDPFLMFVPPYETFGHRYILNTQKIHSYYNGDQRDIFDSYLSMIISSAHVGEVQINGQPVAASEFSPIGDSGFSGASIHVAKDSTFDISAPVPLGAWIYGWALYESYGFTGGMYGALDAATAQFTLTQSASQAPFGSTHHVRAQLKNSSGLVVQGARVDFAVTGANPSTGFGYTAADGSVEFSWIGAQAGADTVTATTGTLTATATVTWLANTSNQPPIVHAGPDRVVKVGDPLQLQGLVQDDGLPTGGQLTALWSALPGSGDVAFSNPSSATTTATFVYPGQYHLLLTGYDGQFSGEDEVIVNVDIPPTILNLEPSPLVIDQGKEWSVVVNARDQDGTIVRVELLDGVQVLATHEQNDPQVYYLTIGGVLNTLGQHTITLRLTDNQGATSERSFEVTVRPAPTVQILTPADNTSFAAGDSISFTASANSTGGAIVRVVYQDVTDYPFELGDGSGANYQFTWTPDYAGTRLIAATAYDSEGASGTSTPISVTILSPGDPTIVITSPEGGSSVYLGQSTTFHADAIAAAPATIDSVYFYDGNHYLGYANSPPYELQWYPGTNGTHTLQAEVYDTFGGYASASITVNVISVADLNISLVQPRSNVPVKANSPTILSALIDNVIGNLDGVEFYVDGNFIGDGTNVSVNWIPPAIGDYQVEVYAYSSDPFQDGYVSTTVTVSNLHSPAVQWTAPANSTSFAPGASISLQAQASDIDGNLTKLQFQADGQPLSESLLSGGAGVATFNWDNAGPGWHALTALATDDTIQNGADFLRVFVQRTIANNIFPPTSLVATTSSSTADVGWSPPADSTNLIGYVIERKLGRQGTWEEIATVDSSLTSYRDEELSSEIYYVYRVASLTLNGAISSYSNEAVAITRAEVPRYVIIDLGDSLQESGVAAALQRSRGGRGIRAQNANGGNPISPPIEVGASRATSISDDGEILLEGIDNSGHQVHGKYLIWRPTDTPISHFEDKFTAERITRDGTVVGSIDKTRPHGDAEVSETHGVYWPKGAWSNASAEPIDITPIPEAYNDPNQDENVDTDWLLTHFNSSGRAWWTSADPNASAKFPWEVIWRGRIADRNRLGAMTGEATIVRQSRAWSEWQALALANPMQAEPSTPYTDAGSSLLWSNGAQDPPQWSYFVNGLAISAEASASALNDNGTAVGGLAFNTGASDYVTRFGDNLPRTHAFRSTGAQNGQQSTDLGTLGDGRFSWALDINKDGVGTGYSTLRKADDANRPQAVVWEATATTPTALPTLLGTNASYPDGYGYAHAISDKGQIVGQSLAVNSDHGPNDPPVVSAAALWLKNAVNDPTMPGFLQDPQWEVANLNTQIDSSATEDLPNGQTLTYRRWHLDNAVGINKNGWIVGTGVRTQYDPEHNQLVSESRSFLLVPFELKDVKGAGNSDDVIIATQIQKQANPPAAAIARIEPHLGQDNAPQMPQLEARFVGAMSVDWKLQVKYDRGNGARAPRNQLEDTVMIPNGDGFVSVSTTQPWRIYEEADWANQISSNGFFGGEATLTVRPQGQREQKFYFRIGGKNPDNALARQFIDAQATSAELFSYAIAKHETAEYRFAGSLYNQFTSNQRSVWSTWPLGSPTWNNDGANLPGGYGLFQITGSANVETANIPRKQIWNWQDNVHAYFAIMRHPSKRGLAGRFYNEIKNKSSQWRTAFNDCLPPSIPVGNHQFSSDEAIWITAYNGWRGKVRDHYIFDPNKPCGLGPSNRWFWDPPPNPDEPYIDKVERRIDP
jgi:IgGFc binding protein/Big-like domain-containing protein